MGITGSNPALLAGQDAIQGFARQRTAIVQGLQARDGAHHTTRDQLDHRRRRHARVGRARLPQRPPQTSRSPSSGTPSSSSAPASPATTSLADWKQHNANLKPARPDLLNAKRFHALRFFTPDGATDLTVGLADQHLWAGGGTTAGNGIYCNPNIPTEECFTTPHKSRVNGVVTASKPLSHQGTLIENIRCTFKDGKHRGSHGNRRRGRPQQAHLHRRRRPPARRSRPRPQPLAHRAVRRPLLEHPLRRERRQPHRSRPGLLHLPHRRRKNVRRPNSQPSVPTKVPHPRRLDDRRPRPCPSTAFPPKAPPNLSCATATGYRSGLRQLSLKTPAWRVPSPSLMK